jgi:DNA-binding MarR family transcriptional regulator
MLYGGSSETLDTALGDALLALIEHGPLRMGELAACLRVDASTATRTVARLIDAGLASRGPAGADGRVVGVEATDLGRRRHAAMLISAREAIDEILSAFGPDDRTVLADLLDRLVASIDTFVSVRRNTTTA